MSHETDNSLLATPPSEESKLAIIDDSFVAVLPPALGSVQPVASPECLPPLHEESQEGNEHARDEVPTEEECLVGNSEEAVVNERGKNLEESAEEEYPKAEIHESITADHKLDEGNTATHDQDEEAIPMSLEVPVQEVYESKDAEIITITESRQTMTPEPTQEHQIQPPAEAVVEVPTNESSGSKENATMERIIEDLYQTCVEEKAQESKQCCTCDVRCTCFQKGPLLTKSLRRGRSRGWAMFKTIVFPLVQDVARAVWVILEFITALIGLILSLLSLLRQDRVEVFNYVHLAIVSLSIVLGLIDMVGSLRCKSCATCRHQAYNVAQDKHDCCSCCGKFIDIIRMLLAEALIYPLIICDIFEIVTGRAFEGERSTDRLSFALFILSCLSYVLYVFIARIVILAGMITKVQKIRMRPTLRLNWRETYSISALCYQLVFFVHLLFQMITQVLALIAIGACIYLENHHFYEDGNTDETIKISEFLWYMIASGYITPVIGFFSFFLVTYYWVQEFPIALCLDMISLWKMKRGPEDFVDIKDKLQEPRNTSFILAFLEQLMPSFKELHGRNWCFKFTYPFRNPMIVFLCICYGLVQVAFAASSIVVLALSRERGTPDELPLQTLLGWLTYFSVAIGIGGIANAYAFAVGCFWTTIFPALILAVAAVVTPLLVVALVPIILYYCIASHYIDSNDCKI